jgi:hypothetical protein
VSGCTGGKSGLAPASFAYQQACEAFVAIAINPVAHHFFLDGFEQSMSRDLSHGLTCRHFEDGCRFHAEVRFLMVVTRPAQFALLLWR